MLSRGLALRAVRLASTVPATRTAPAFTRSRLPNAPIIRTATHSTEPATRGKISGEPSLADAKIDDITELFYTAQDEFEIAQEETEKQTVYAEDDRKAAREELEKVQEAFRAVVEGGDEELAKEVKGRIGQRIRELERGVEAMEESAQEHD